MYADLIASAGFDRDREIRDFTDKGQGTPGTLLSAEDVPVDPDSVEAPDTLVGKTGDAGGAQGAYARLKGLFPCAPGAKEGETYRKFLERVEAGYNPEDIVDGAWDYLASPGVPPSEKWRYPLKWLSDDDAFRAFVRCVPEPPLSAMPAHERAGRAKFVHCGNDRESFWLVMERGGAQTEVDCDPDRTVEEARAAFELQLLREQRADFGEEW